MHPHGVYRDFIGGGDWQAQVQKWLDQAGMVVLVMGDSPGIEWEIELGLDRSGAARDTPRSERRRASICLVQSGRPADDFTSTLVQHPPLVASPCLRSYYAGAWCFPDRPASHI
jgi:hypothetical protein